MEHPLDDHEDHPNQHENNCVLCKEARSIPFKFEEK